VVGAGEGDWGVSGRSSDVVRRVVGEVSWCVTDDGVWFITVLSEYVEGTC
jgi:hypothetical protein